MTIHNEASKGDIAKIVLMPGDPMRAKLIAEKYLTNYKLVNRVRGIYAYTGYYKDKLITVMASGMGIPSMGIYSYELYNYYDVEYIIRIGTMGALTDKLGVYDIVLAKEAYSLSSYAKTLNGYQNDVAYSAPEINEVVKKTAKDLNRNVYEGCVYTSDCFYGNLKTEKLYQDYGCLGIEMETFGLFTTARFLNKKATAILTISDSLVTKEKLDAHMRETSLTDMIELALESAYRL